jgi:hypothetical protein
MQVATISFKTKVRNVFNADETLAYQIVAVPTLTRSHCDMAAFRKHSKFGAYANSDLFPNLLAKLKRERLGDHIRLDRIPDGVAIDTSGFLAIVTVDA